MRTSVEAHLTGPSYLSTVKQLLDSPLAEESVLILYEGVDEEKLYKRFFVKDDTKVRYYARPEGNGCGNFMPVLAAYMPAYGDKFIVLKDADFDHLNGTRYPYENLFLTDAHDMEMSLLDADAEEKIRFEFLIDDERLFAAVMDDLAELSYTKWYNSANKFGLNVKVLRLSKLYTAAAPVALSDCITAMNSCGENKRLHPISEAEIQNFKTQKPSCSLFQLTNGHDFCDALAMKINCIRDQKRRAGASLSKAKFGEDDIARCLRLTYTYEKFKKTAMYAHLLQWQQQTGKALLR